MQNGSQTPKLPLWGASGSALTVGRGVDDQELLVFHRHHPVRQFGDLRRGEENRPKSLRV